MKTENSKSQKKTKNKDEGEKKKSAAPETLLPLQYLPRRYIFHNKYPFIVSAINAKKFISSKGIFVSNKFNSDFLHE